MGNVILGNYIGLDASGSFAVPNPDGGIGIFYNGVGHVIGGEAPGAGNVISGNGSAGIWLSGSGVSNNVVRGNFLGLNAAGTAAVPNTVVGIYAINGASSNCFIGNVMSGNTSEGLRIAGAGSTANIAQGNFFGTDATGTTAVANGFAGVSVIRGATSNLIGGAAAGEGNLASGNYIGIAVGDPGTSGNVVQGNRAGTDVTGTIAVGNGFAGLTVGNGAASNIIGGAAAGQGNLFSANYYGAVISDRGTAGNVIQGNFVGPDITGKAALANGFAGLAVWTGAASNLIGGAAAGAANVVSGNGAYGLFISDTNTSDNLFEGNLIGTDDSGAGALGNGFANVELQSGATGNFIGGVAAGTGNVIAFSGSGPGVVLFDASTTNNAIRGNSIFDNAGLGIDLNNDGVTPNHTGFLSGPNDFQKTIQFSPARGAAAARPL